MARNQVLLPASPEGHAAALGFSDPADPTIMAPPATPRFRRADAAFNRFNSHYVRACWAAVVFSAALHGLVLYAPRPASRVAIDARESERGAGNPGEAQWAAVGSLIARDTIEGGNEPRAIVGDRESPETSHDATAIVPPKIDRHPTSDRETTRSKSSDAEASNIPAPVPSDDRPQGEEAAPKPEEHVTEHAIAGPSDADHGPTESTSSPAEPSSAVPSSPGPEFVAFDSPPEPIRTVKPSYPELARETHAEGIVYVRVTVDETGRVVEATVVQSDAIPSLEEAALAAAKAWEFRPAKQRDVPVKARIVLPFRFRLSGEATSEARDGR